MACDWWLIDFLNITKNERMVFIFMIKRNRLVCVGCQKLFKVLSLVVMLQMVNLIDFDTTLALRKTNIAPYKWWLGDWETTFILGFGLFSGAFFCQF